MSQARKRRILIIDDEAALARLLQLNLEQTGAYEVRTEERGAHGLAAARAFRPDLILCDLIMPDLGGGAVAAQIQADADLQETPVVFLTAVVSKQEAAAYGGVLDGHPCLAKPASLEEVVQCIERHVKKK